MNNKNQTYVFCYNLILLQKNISDYNIEQCNLNKVNMV